MLISWQLFHIPSLPNQQLQFLSEKLKREEISRESYIFQYKKIIPNAVIDDTASIRESGSRGEPVTTSQVYNSISADSGLNLEAMILQLLLKTSSGKGLVNQQSPLDSKALFERLILNKENVEDDIKFDSLVVFYALNKVFTFAQANQSGLEEWAQSVRMIDFFKQHLEKRVSSILMDLDTHRTAAIEKAKTLMNIYGSLAFLPMDQRWLILSLYRVLNLVPSKQLSISGLRLKMTIQAAYMDAVTGPALKIDDLLSTATSLADNLSHIKVFEGLYIRWLDKFNVYIEKHLASQDDLQTVIRILDTRWEINNRVRKNMIPILTENPNIRNDLIVTHPVFKTHLTRAIETAEQLNGEIKSLKTTRSFDEFISEGMDRIRTQIGIDFNQFGNHRLTLKYQSLFNQIEIGRAYLEDQDNGETAEEFVKLDQSRLDYKKLRRSLEEILSLRFEGKELSPETNLLPRLEGQRSFSQTKKISISSFASQKGPQEGTMVFQRAGKISLGPGIYFTDGPTRLELNHVEFHPLALIYSQGYPLEIDADLLEGAWIDTSGLDQIQDNPEPPKDGVAATSDGKNMGRSPSRPIDADSGGNAGALRLKGTVNNSILVSFGGDGENGFSGAASPQCNNQGIYKPVEFTRVVTTEKRPRNCGICKAVKLFDISLLCPTTSIQRQACGSEEVKKKVTEKIEVSAGLGGRGGNGGNGASITLEGEARSGMSIFVNSVSGKAGINGAKGSCGPSKDQGDSSQEGQRGQSFHKDVEVRDV